MTFPKPKTSGFAAKTRKRPELQLLQLWVGAVMFCNGSRYRGSIRALCEGFWAQRLRRGVKGGLRFAAYRLIWVWNGFDSSHKTSKALEIDFLFREATNPASTGNPRFGLSGCENRVKG